MSFLLNYESHTLYRAISPGPNPISKAPKIRLIVFVKNLPGYDPEILCFASLKISCSGLKPSYLFVSARNSQLVPQTSACSDGATRAERLAGTPGVPLGWIA